MGVPTAIVDFQGNTISIIDVDLARGSPNAEAARVRVGTDDPNGQKRSFRNGTTGGVGETNGNGKSGQACGG